MVTVAYDTGREYGQYEAEGCPSPWPQGPHGSTEPGGRRTANTAGAVEEGGGRERGTVATVAPHTGRDYGQYAGDAADGDAVAGPLRDVAGAAHVAGRDADRSTCGAVAVAIPLPDVAGAAAAAVAAPLHEVAGAAAAAVAAFTGAAAGLLHEVAGAAAGLLHDAAGADPLSTGAVSVSVGGGGLRCVGHSAELLDVL